MTFEQWWAKYNQPGANASGISPFKEARMWEDYESVARDAWDASFEADALTDAEIGALKVALSDDDWAQDEVGETLRALLERFG